MQFPSANGRPRLTTALCPVTEAGNKRAKEHGLTNCKFQEGDASNLSGLKDDTFHVVVSIFGAIFAPKPFDVAKEMVRVTRPEGGSLWETGSQMIRHWSRKS